MDLLNIIQDYLHERGVAAYIAASTGTGFGDFWLVANGHMVEKVGQAAVLLGGHLTINMCDPGSLPYIYEVITTTTGELYASES